MQATSNKFTVVKVLDFDSAEGTNLPINSINGLNLPKKVRGGISLTRKAISDTLNHPIKADPYSEGNVKDLNPLIAVMCQEEAIDSMVGYINDALGSMVSILAAVDPEKYVYYFINAIALKQVYIGLSNNPGESTGKDSVEVNLIELREKYRNLVSERVYSSTDDEVSNKTVAILINPQTVMSSASNLFIRTWIRMGDDLLETDSLLANSFISCDQYESITNQCITCKHSLGDCLEYTTKKAGYPDIKISNTSYYPGDGSFEEKIYTQINDNYIKQADLIVKNLSEGQELMSRYSIEYIKPMYALNGSNVMLTTPILANVNLSEDNVLRNVDTRNNMIAAAMKTRNHKSSECSECSIRETCNANPEHKFFLKNRCSGAVRPPKTIPDTSSVISLLEDSKDVYKFMVYLPGTKLEKPIASSAYSSHHRKITPWDSVVVASVTHESLIHSDPNTFIVRSIDELSDILYCRKYYTTKNYRRSTKWLSQALISNTIASRVVSTRSINPADKNSYTSSWVCRISFSGYQFQDVEHVTLYISLPIVLEMAGHVYSDPTLYDDMEYGSSESLLTYGSANPLKTYGAEKSNLPIKVELLGEYYSKFAPNENVSRSHWGMIKIKDQIQYLIDPIFDKNDVDLYLQATNITHRAEYATGGFGHFSGYTLRGDCLILLNPRLGGVLLSSLKVSNNYRTYYSTSRLDVIKTYGGSMLEPRNILFFHKWNPVSVVSHSSSFNNGNVFRKSPSTKAWTYMAETFPIQNSISSIIHACEMAGANSSILVPAKASKKFSMHSIKSTTRYNSYRKIPTSKSEVISILPSNPLPGFTKLYNHITSNMLVTGNPEYKSDPEFRADIARRLITELHLLLKVNIGYKNSVCKDTGSVVVIPVEIPYIIYSEDALLSVTKSTANSKIITLDADLLAGVKSEDLYKMQSKDFMVVYHRSLSRAIHLRVLKLKNTNFIPTKDCSGASARITRQSSIYEIRDGLTGALTVNRDWYKGVHVGIIKSPSVIATLTEISNLCKSDSVFSLPGLYQCLKKA
jgi:hypothetical protein